MLKWYVSFFVHKIRRIVLATEASLEHLFIIIIMSPSIGGGGIKCNATILPSV